VIPSFSDATWESEVLRSEIPVVVDFWAVWCRPCEHMALSLQAAVRAYPGSIRVGRLNVEENPLTAEKYSVRGLPTLLVLKRGEVAARRVGLLIQTGLLKLLGETLGPP
jgi:thioredoxin 1